MKSHLLSQNPRIPESFITAFGGSPSNPQLCWGLLIGPKGHVLRIEKPCGGALCVGELPARGSASVRSLWDVPLLCVEQARCPPRWKPGRSLGSAPSSITAFSADDRYRSQAALSPRQGRNCQH